MEQTSLRLLLMTTLSLALPFMGCAPEKPMGCVDDNDCRLGRQCVAQVCEWSDEGEAPDAAGVDDVADPSDAFLDIGLDTNLEPGMDIGGPEPHPLNGVIDGQGFDLRSGHVNRVGDSYVVTLRNYPWGCDGQTEIFAIRPLLVNFEIIDREPGTSDVGIYSGHGASLQSGVMEDEIQSFVVEAGTLRLDHWTTTAGEEITGSLEFRAGEHAVQGEFSATLCP